MGAQITKQTNIQTRDISNINITNQLSKVTTKLVENIKNQTNISYDASQVTILNNDTFAGNVDLSQTMTGHMQVTAISHMTSDTNFSAFLSTSLGEHFAANIQSHQGNTAKTSPGVSIFPPEVAPIFQDTTSKIENSYTQDVYSNSSSVNDRSVSYSKAFTSVFNSQTDLSEITIVSNSSFLKNFKSDQKMNISAVIKNLNTQQSYTKDTTKMDNHVTKATDLALSSWMTNLTKTASHWAIYIAIIVIIIIILIALPKIIGTAVNTTPQGRVLKTATKKFAPMSTAPTFAAPTSAAPTFASTNMKNPRQSLRLSSSNSSPRQRRIKNYKFGAFPTHNFSSKSAEYEEYNEENFTSQRNFIFRHKNKLILILVAVVILLSIYLATSYFMNLFPFRINPDVVFTTEQGQPKTSIDNEELVNPNVVSKTVMTIHKPTLKYYLPLAEVTTDERVNSYEKNGTMKLIKSYDEVNARSSLASLYCISKLKVDVQRLKTYIKEVVLRQKPNSGTPNGAETNQNAMQSIALKPGQVFQASKDIFDYTVSWSPPPVECEKGEKPLETTEEHSLFQMAFNDLWDRFNKDSTTSLNSWKDIETLAKKENISVKFYYLIKWYRDILIPSAARNREDTYKALQWDSVLIYNPFEYLLRLGKDVFVSKFTDLKGTDNFSTDDDKQFLAAVKVDDKSIPMSLKLACDILRCASKVKGDFAKFMSEETYWASSLEEGKKKVKASDVLDPCSNNNTAVNSESHNLIKWIFEVRNTLAKEIYGNQEIEYTYLYGLEDTERTEGLIKSQVEPCYLWTTHPPLDSTKIQMLSGATFPSVHQLTDGISNKEESGEEKMMYCLDFFKLKKSVQTTVWMHRRKVYIVISILVILICILIVTGVFMN